MKGKAIGAQQNQEMPFEQVVEMVQPVRSLAHSALFQVMFAWQNAGESPQLELEGVEVEPLRMGRQVSKFDLTLSLRQEGARIRAEWDMRRRCLRGRRLSATWDITAGCCRGWWRERGRRLAGLPLLGEEEREQLLYGWNDTAVKYGGAVRA